MRDGRKTPTPKPEVVRDTALPRYVPPTVRTYTSEEIIEKIGPAQACSPTPCASFP